MPENFTAHVTTIINTPIAKVWDALINPESIKQYLFGTNAISDWKVGSTILFKGVWEGKPYEDKGIILKIEPEKIFQYNYWSGFSGKADIPENYQKVTYELKAVDGGTELTVSQENLPDEGHRQHSEKNWGMVLETIKNILSK